VGAGTKLTDRYLPVRVNGDLAMFAGVNKALLAREEVAPGTIFDHEFIETYCDGFEEVCQSWRDLEWSVLEFQSGLTREQIEDFASDVVAARSVIVTWAMGITQHRNAVATIREIVNFPAAARQHRAARCGTVADSRAQQRAG
jgi:anaerobic selenocysteine-containing dehydrogenase